MNYKEPKLARSGSSNSQLAPSSTLQRLYRRVLTALGLVSTLLVLSILVAITERAVTGDSVFFTTPNLLNVGRQTAITAIVAMGMTFVIISGGIDLSVGSVMALSGCGFAVMNSQLHMPLALSLIVPLLGACFFGLVNGILIVKGRIQPFIATLGTMSMARGVVLLITEGQSLSNFPPAFNWLGGGRLWGLPVVPILIMALIALITHFVLAHTKLGLMAYAIGGNDEATWLSGNDTGRFKIYLYVLGSALAGFGGLLLASRMNATVASMANGEEFNVIAAAVMGGTSLMGGEGSIIGTVIGALILSVVRNGLNLLSVSPYWQTFSIGAIVVIAVLVDQWRPGRRR